MVACSKPVNMRSAVVLPQDPFCQGAIRPVSQALYRLKDLAPDRFYQGECFRSYYMRTEIAEEIGYFAQVPGDCQVVFSLMREDKPFSALEFRPLGTLSPMITALMRRHWVDLAKDFALRSAPKPELIGPGLDRLTPVNARSLAGSSKLFGRSNRTTVGHLYWHRADPPPQHLSSAWHLVTT